MEFECVWCHRTMEVDHAGWPYVHSIALLHYHVCSARPAGVSAEAIELMAARFADAIEKESPGSRSEG
jgi:hypothetical protein